MEQNDTSYQICTSSKMCTFVRRFDLTIDHYRPVGTLGMVDASLYQAATACLPNSHLNFRG